jgi:hypothetical protein
MEKSLVITVHSVLARAWYKMVVTQGQVDKSFCPCKVHHRDGYGDVTKSI